MDTSYNGWKNYKTWNIALWLNNDEGLYNIKKHCSTYKDLVNFLNDSGVNKTPDGVSYSDEELDTTALDEVVKEK